MLDASLELLQVVNDIPIAQCGHGEGAAADDAVDLGRLAGDILGLDDDLPRHFPGFAGALLRRRDRFGNARLRRTGAASFLTDHDIHVGWTLASSRVALFEPTQLPLCDFGIAGDEDGSAGTVDVMGGAHGEAHVLALDLKQDDTQVAGADADGAHSRIGYGGPERAMVTGLTFTMGRFISTIPGWPPVSRH